MTALNKFAWGGFLHKLAKLAGAVCPVLGMAIEAAAEIVDYANSKISVENLDPKDAVILTNWDTKKYTPFYLSLAHIVQNNILNSSLTIEVRAQFANYVLLKIDAVKAYYATNETTGLTSKGISARLEYLNDSLKNISETIMGNDFSIGIGGSFNMIPIEQNFKSIDLSLLQVPSTTKDFTVSTNLFELSKDIEVLTPSPATLATHPPITPQEIENVIESANNGVIPPPISTPIDKTTIAKVVGVLLISFGLMSSSKSKSKSE